MQYLQGSNANESGDYLLSNPDSLAIELNDGMHELVEMGTDLSASRIAKFRTVDVDGTVGVYAGHAFKGEIRLNELPRGTAPVNVTVTMVVDVKGCWTADIECDETAEIPPETNTAETERPNTETDVVLQPKTVADMTLSTVSAAPLESPVPVEKTLTHDSDNFESTASKLTTEQHDDVITEQLITDAQNGNELELARFTQSTDDVKSSTADEKRLPRSDTDAIEDAGDEMPEVRMITDTDMTPKKKKSTIWSWIRKAICLKKRKRQN